MQNKINDEQTDIITKNKSIIIIPIEIAVC